jgi:hypothetical protein
MFKNVITTAAEPATTYFPNPSIYSSPSKWLLSMKFYTNINSFCAFISPSDLKILSEEYKLLSPSLRYFRYCNCSSPFSANPFCVLFKTGLSTEQDTGL